MTNISEYGILMAYKKSINLYNYAVPAEVYKWRRKIEKVHRMMMCFGQWRLIYQVWLSRF